LDGFWWFLMAVFPSFSQIKSTTTGHLSRNRGVRIFGLCLDDGREHLWGLLQSVGDVLGHWDAERNPIFFVWHFLFSNDV
jgi:hypothetical protein